MPPSPTKPTAQLSSSTPAQAAVNGIDQQGQEFLDGELQDWISDANPHAASSETDEAPAPRPRASNGKFTSVPAEPEPQVLTSDPLAQPRGERTTDDEPAAEPVKKTKDENMARMRTTLEEQRTRIASLEAAQAEISTKEETLRAAQDERDIYKEQIEELAGQLEQYRGYKTIVDLQSDPEYREQFIEPMFQLKNDLYETADAYGIDREVIDHAVTISGVPQLERFLVEHFDSTIAINRVMETVKQLRGVALKKSQADLEPQELYVNLKEAKKIKELEDEQRSEKAVGRMADVGWSESLEYYQTNDVAAPYFRKEPGNIRQNRMVDAILEDAKGLHGSVIQELRKHGLKNLPYALSQRLSAMPLKAVGFDMLAKQVSDLQKELRERDKTIEELNAYKRPNGSNAFRSENGQQEEAPMNPKEDSFFDAIIDSARSEVEGQRR